MKRRFLSAAVFVLAACCIAAFLVMPSLYLKAQDTRLLQTVHTRTDGWDEAILSPSGQSVPLAAILYAQAHLFNESDLRAPSQEPVDASVLAPQQQALKDCGVLPASYELAQTEGERSTVGLLHRYYWNNSVLQMEPETGKIVGIGWDGDIPADEDTVIRRYVEYLGLSQAAWERLESTAMTLQVAALYAPELQLYVSVSSNQQAGTYHNISVISMTRAQVADIARFAPQEE